jgi:hypothetical protein
MTGEEESEALHDAWQEQGRWSLAASRLKAKLDRARAVALGLTVTGGILGALAVQFETISDSMSRSLAVLAGVAMACVPFVQRATTTAAISKWTRVRSVSEGLKTEVYGYLAGSSRYRVADRDRELRARTRAIVSNAPDIRSEAATVEIDELPIPEITDVDSYVAKRLDPQIDGYYRPNAAKYQRRLLDLRRAGLATGLVGALLGVAAGAGGVARASIWVPVATTLAAAVGAHIAAGRYERMIIEYLRTADQLTYLRDGWRDEQLTESEFIDACEDVISVENQAWMARWNGPETAEQTLT